MIWNFFIFKTYGSSFTDDSIICQGYLKNTTESASINKNYIDRAKRIENSLEKKIAQEFKTYCENMKVTNILPRINSDIHKYISIEEAKKLMAKPQVMTGKTHLIFSFLMILDLKTSIPWLFDLLGNSKFELINYSNNIVISSELDELIIKLPNLLEVSHFDAIGVDRFHISLDNSEFISHLLNTCKSKENLKSILYTALKSVPYEHISCGLINNEL